MEEKLDHVISSYHPSMGNVKLLIARVKLLRANFYFKNFQAMHAKHIKFKSEIIDLNTQFK